MRLQSIFLIMALVVGSFAQAKEITLGTSFGEKNYPKLSIRFEANGGATMRYKPTRYEVRCTKYRKDLCGVEDKVDVIEVNIPTESLTYVSPSLIHFEFDSFASGFGVKAILTDGSEINILSAAGSLDVFTETSLQWRAHQTFEPKTLTKINMQLWGNRADGLDPIVQSIGSKSFFISDQDFVIVPDSLF